jgi:hypothetical protein
MSVVLLPKSCFVLSNCDVCKACLTSQAVLSISAIINFREYSDKKLSLTYPAEKLVETAKCICHSSGEYDGRCGSLEPS